MHFGRNKIEKNKNEIWKNKNANFMGQVTLGNCHPSKFMDQY